MRSAVLPLAGHAVMVAIVVNVRTVETPIHDGSTVAIVDLGVRCSHGASHPVRIAPVERHACRVVMGSGRLCLGEDHTRDRKYSAGHSPDKCRTNSDSPQAIAPLTLVLGA